MPPVPFIRYLVKGPTTLWWDHFGGPFLQDRGWQVLTTEEFVYENSYGFDRNVVRQANEVRQFDYCQNEATIILEYMQEPPNDCLFDPHPIRTVVDDLLTFMSLFTGEHCECLYRERRLSDGKYNVWRPVQVNHDRNLPGCAGSIRRAIEFFERALNTISTINRTQFELAIRWFFSALREREIGRALVEPALNWVCLESQANYLRLDGNKFQMVSTLLNDQGFPNIPRLQNFYRLRNDAFHDGQLSNLSAEDAQEARSTGQALVRAQVLNLLGMEHTDFDNEFMSLYTT